MLIDHYIIKNEFDAFFYSIVLLAFCIGLAIGYLYGKKDGKDQLHDGWIIKI